MNVPEPVSIDHLIQYMLTQRLQFTPGKIPIVIILIVSTGYHPVDTMDYARVRRRSV